MDRLPPHSLESEQALLGCCFSYAASAEVIDDVIDQVPVEAFYDLKHQAIYETLVQMHREGKPLELTSLAEVLKAANQLESAGGYAYLSSLPECTPSPHNALYYIEVLQEHHLRRRIIQLGTSLVQSGFDETQLTRADLIDRVEKAMMEVSNGNQTRNQRTIRELVRDAINTIEEWHQNKGAIMGVSTGFGDFDQMTTGLHSGDMVVIAGRPSVGKTTFVLNVMVSVTVQSKLPAGMFSLEMSDAQLAMKILMSQAHVNLRDVREGFLADRDFPKLTGAAGKLASAPLYIDDTPGLTMLQIRSRARQWKQRYGVKLIGIDYMQLIHSNRNRENRQLEVAEVSLGIKELAKELQIPIIVLCQLNRAVERENRTPRLSDLRESGAIEQDADLVAFLYPDGEQDDADPDADTISVALRIAKQRNGPTGTIRLVLLRNMSRFEQAAKVSDEDTPIHQGEGIP